MNERVMPGPVCNADGIREAVCVHTKKIYDSCRDRDCIENLRFYPTQSSQCVIDRALSIRSGKAELLNVHIDVEPTGFNKGFYSVDIRYFYRITAEAFVGSTRPVEISGLSIFDKRVILCGGEGSAKIFSSEYAFDELDEQNMLRRNLPVAVVEVVDPIVLNMKLYEPNECCVPGALPPFCPTLCTPPCDDSVCRDSCLPFDCDCGDIPPHIGSCFGSDLCFSPEKRRICVTLGQFSIIRLEREMQLLIPAYDYCLPTKECSCANVEEDPCEIFRQVKFPVDDFFPPDCNTPSDDDCHPCR